MPTVTPSFTNRTELLLTPHSISQPNSKSSHSRGVGIRLTLYPCPFHEAAAGRKSATVRTRETNDVWATRPPSIRDLKSTTVWPANDASAPMLAMRMTRRFFLRANRSMTPGANSGAATTSA